MVRSSKTQTEMMSIWSMPMGMCCMTMCLRMGSV